MVIETNSYKASCDLSVPYCSFYTVVLKARVIHIIIRRTFTQRPQSHNVHLNKTCLIKTDNRDFLGLVGLYKRYTSLINKINCPLSYPELTTFGYYTLQVSAMFAFYLFLYQTILHYAPSLSMSYF